MHPDPHAAQGGRTSESTAELDSTHSIRFGVAVRDPPHARADGMPIGDCPRQARPRVAQPHQRPGEMDAATGHEIRDQITHRGTPSRTGHGSGMTVSSG